MTVTRPILYEHILFAVFWILGTCGFIGDELFDVFTKQRSLILLACDALIVLLGLACLRHRADVITIVSLTVLAITASVPLNGIPWKLALNGTRVFVGAMFVYPIFRYFWDDPKRHDHFIRRLDKNLYLFLWLQVFCLSYQYFVYGAGDHGGGSLGNWYSGTISMLIYLISFYLLRKRVDSKHFWSSLWINKQYFFLLLPTFLNETKVSFVLLLLYFILLMPIDKRLFVRAIVITPIAAILFFVGYTTYRLTYQGEFGGTSAGNADIFSEEYLLEYMLMDVENAEEDAEWNMENSDNGTADIPRVTKFLLLAVINEDNPGHIPLGFGVGHFKGGTQVEHTDFYNEYEWYLIGTIPYLLHIYLQLGLVGVLWFIVFLVSLFVRRPEHYPRRDWNLHLFLALLIVLNFFYIEALRDLEFCIVVYGLILAGWLPDAKRNLTADDEQEPAQELLPSTIS